MAVAPPAAKPPAAPAAKVMPSLTKLVEWAAPAPQPMPEKWQLVWSDEFEGDALDRSKWAVDVSRPGNEGLGDSDFLDSPETVQVSNGNLKIISRPNTHGRWDSAKLHTQGKQSWKYGRFEARIKVPPGAGTWPAFWMMPDIPENEPWPQQGEIDIMEHVGKQPSMTQANVHYADLKKKHRYSSLEYYMAKPLSADYHVFGVDWSPTTYTFYVDGREIFQTSSNPTGRGFPFNRNFFLILNLAIGGGWALKPPSNDIFPATMYVDYVRVYRDTTLKVPAPVKRAATAPPAVKVAAKPPVAVKPPVAPKRQ
jgi:beta-glucanase (GH16 family)